MLKNSDPELWRNTIHCLHRCMKSFKYWLFWSHNVPIICLYIYIWNETLCRYVGISPLIIYDPVYLFPCTLYLACTIDSLGEVHAFPNRCDHEIPGARVCGSRLLSVPTCSSIIARGRRLRRRRRRSVENPADQYAPTPPGLTCPSFRLTYAHTLPL